MEDRNTLFEDRGKRIEIEPALLENRKRRIENGNLLVHDIESNSKTKHSILLLCPLASNLYTLKAYRIPFYTVTSAFSAKSKILSATRGKRIRGKKFQPFDTLKALQK